MVSASRICRGSLLTFALEADIFPFGFVALPNHPNNTDEKCDPGKKNHGLILIQSAISGNLYCNSRRLRLESEEQAGDAA
jgi:hypothetical protein